MTPFRDATGGPITTVIPMTDQTRIGEARRFAITLGDGGDETAVGRVAIVTTELATNLIRHAKDGAMLLRRVAGAERSFDSIEVVAIDRGPGIADVSRSLRDGFSTHGTPGTGLGAVSRLTERFDIYSLPGKGTIVSCQIPLADNQRARDAANGDPIDVGVTCVPMGHEVACGDGWCTHLGQSGTILAMVVDGLGHGPQAAQAADAAKEAFRQAVQRHVTPAEIVQLAHLALRPTRGAALAVAEIDVARGTVHYAGIGNISGAIIGVGRTQNLVSLNGIAGHQVGRIREFAYEWTDGATLFMHSDGIATRWTLDEYPGLSSRHPSMRAAVIWREFSRGRDDATVLAVRPHTPQTVSSGHSVSAPPMEVL